jgi:dihydroneopterin aldolase
MTLMLACVRSPDEAETAIAGGCDLVEAIEADASSGSPAPNAVRDLVAAVAGCVPVWAVAGGTWLGAEATRGRAEALAGAGADSLKIVLHPDGPWVDTLDAVAPLAGTVHLVASLPADRRGDADLLTKAEACGFRGAMLEPGVAGSSRLLDHAGPADLARFAAACKDAGLHAGYAGMLEAPDIPRLLALDPWVLGFRSALCGGHDRGGVLDPRATRAIRGLIPAVIPDDAAVVLARATPREDTGPHDRIFVRDLEVAAFVGAYRDERDKPQRLRFDVIADVRRPATATDDLRNIVSYDLIIDAIERLVGLGHVDLLETLAERLAEEMLRHDQVIRMTVRVEKPDMARGTVGVEIVRSRAEESAKVLRLRSATAERDPKTAP